MDKNIIKQKIAIKKLNKIVIPKGNNLSNNDVYNIALSFHYEMLRIGYALHNNDFEKLCCLSRDQIISLYGDVISAMKEIKGSNVKYKPMYKNFPEEVMNTADCYLYNNAIQHYASNGTWFPNSENDNISNETIESLFDFDFKDCKNISSCEESELCNATKNILKSNSALSAEDSEFLKFLLNETNIVVDFDIPFKEILCIYVSHLIEKHVDFTEAIKSPTDILRVAVHLSNGDISLATPTKFKSFKRSLRKDFIRILDSFSEMNLKEDIKANKNVWKKLLHSLHVGEYKQYSVINSVAKDVRNISNIETINSHIEAGFFYNNPDNLLKHLSKRPGVFARRVCHALVAFPKSNKKIIDSFSKIVDNVSSRVLFQLMGALSDKRTKKFAFLKGKSNKIVKFYKEEFVKEHSAIKLKDVINSSLRSRFSKLDSLGKVYIDPSLKKCPIPNDQRCASEGVFNAAKGTHFKLKDKSTIRFFIYWVGQDVDLSAVYLDKDFNRLEDISYYSLKNNEGCHSGDITSAPHGAAEFIELDLTKISNKNARYVAMQVFVFRGPTFKEHSVCYAGWMMKDKVQNKVFDPKTVDQKINLTSNSKTSIPMVFDLKTKEAIWMDCPISFRDSSYQNAKTASCTDILSEVLKKPKSTLFDLFSLHAESRGQIVDEPENADVIFGFDGKVSPFDINIINSEYLI